MGFPTAKVGRKLAQMFLGQYEYTLDDKGRVTLPARFRHMMERGVVITRGADRCLWVFLADKWEQIAAKLDGSEPQANKDSRQFTRLIFSGAIDDIPDKQGRVRIPDHLLQFAGITSNVVIVGVNSRLEIWSQERWAEQQADINEHSEEITERYANLSR